MAVTAYATVAEFNTRFPNTQIPDADLSGYWLPHGALRVNEALGSCFSIPFGSNNETAKDISLSYAWLGLMVRTRPTADSQEIKREVEKRVADICSGSAPMVLTDGTAIYADSTGDQIYSNTMRYKPTFDVRPALRQHVDPDRLSDLDDKDV